MESISTSKTSVAPTTSLPSSPPTSGNDAARTSHAVAELRRNNQSSLLPACQEPHATLPGAHAQQTLFPSLDHTASSQSHGEGSVAIERGVKLHAILVQITLRMITSSMNEDGVVHGDGVSVGSLLRAIIGHVLPVNVTHSAIRYSG